MLATLAISLIRSQLNFRRYAATGVTMRSKSRAVIVAAAGLVLLLVGTGRLGEAVAAVRWSEQTVFVRRFLALAAAGDSTGLARVSTGAEPVTWALTFGRVGPARDYATVRPVW